MRVSLIRINTFIVVTPALNLYYSLIICWFSFSSITASHVHGRFWGPNVRNQHTKEEILVCAFFVVGLRDLSPPALSLKQLLPETLATEPVLLVISPGADPSEELRALAHVTVGDQHYYEVHSYPDWWDYLIFITWPTFESSVLL